MAGRWFRTDIEGIRGIAMVMVLLAHAGFGFAQGGYIGLDLFFVISGFLITTLLLRELKKSGTISLAKFYARRIRRLLPAAALVLVTVVIVSQVLFSPVRNELVSGDVLAAVAYFVNWRLAAQSVDYFAQGFEASPVQHFWSLAVEEQFYLIWPVALLAMAALALKLGGGRRLVVGGFVTVVGLASLIYSGVFTPESPGEAYFSTLTRVWELALGALLAITTIPRLSTLAAGALATGGLVAIGCSFLILDEVTPFPGLIALVPTMGAAAIIVAGTSSMSSLSMRFLSSGPVQYIGRISYCWYLWHWPVLIFAGHLYGNLTPWQGALAVAVSWVPTQLTHTYIEQPVRRSQVLALRPRRAVAVLAAGSGTAALAAVALTVAQPSVPLAPASEVEGATVLQRFEGVQVEARAVRPDPKRAFEDRSRLVDDGCFIKLGEVEQGECAYGDVDSKTTVVLFADSHGEPYFPALEFLAKRNHWRLVALTKSFCSPARIEMSHPREPGPFTDCEKWRERMLDRIVDREKPRLVVVAGAKSRTPMDGERELEGDEARRAYVHGYASTMRTLREGGAQVALVTDVPRAPINVPECVAEHRKRLRECSFPKPEDGALIEREAAARIDGAHLVNTTNAVCADGVCRGVIGDAIVYRDGSHLTATFAATLAPFIQRHLPRVN